MKLRLEFHLFNDLHNNFAISYLQDGQHKIILHAKDDYSLLLSLGDGLLNYYKNDVHHFDISTEPTAYHCMIIQKTLIILDEQDLIFSCPIDDFAHSFFHAYERYLYDLLRMEPISLDDSTLQNMKQQVYALHQILVLHFTDINAMIVE